MTPRFRSNHTRRAARKAYRTPLATGSRRPTPTAPLSLLIVAVLGAGAARAQPAEPASNTEQTFLEHLALARAHTALCEQVMHLPLGSELTVGDWSAREISRQRELRLWVRTRRPLGNARVYSEGTCDVDVCATPEELARCLVAAASQRPSDERQPLTPADITSASSQWPILWGTGAASPGEEARQRKPTGWEDISTEGIELARHAAATDAVYSLLEQAGRLRVTAAQRLQAFLESDGVFEAVFATVKDAATIDVECALDQVAVAQAKIGTTELIRILTDVHEQRYRGDLFHAPDFREMALNTTQSELRATGLAVPPNRYRQRPPCELIDLQMPPWANTALTATGRHQPLDGDTLTRDERIERARRDAINELRKGLETLIVHDDVTVGHLLSCHEELQDDVATFLTGAHATSAPRMEPDDILAMRVELPLARLWRIVRRGMEPVEAGPHDDATTRPTSEVIP